MNDTRTVYGRRPRYGDRAPIKVHWPAVHREIYERRAAEAGLSLGEYLIQTMARAHSIPLPGDEDEGPDSQQALLLGA